MKETPKETIYFMNWSNTPRRRRRELAIRFGLIAIMSLIDVFVESVYTHSEIGYVQSFLFSFVRTSLIWNGSMLIVHWTMARFPLFKATLKLILAQIMALSAYVVVIELGEIYVTENYFHVLLDNKEKNSLILGSLVITFMISSIYASVSFFKAWKENLLRAQALEQANLEARYDTLRNQVNPHFLFNSLNTLLMLVNDNPVASRYVESISEIMRYMLQTRDKEAVLLRDELKIARDYVFIQQSRFGDKLNVEFAVEERFYHYAIPPLCLQMLLENALKHNVVSKENPLQVRVWIKDNSFIAIENTIRAKIDKEPSTGVGLENIRNRYLHLSGKNIVVKQEGGKFVVLLPLFEKSI